MLEIFRHIVEDASYKRCENENCRKLVVRQAGGAEHGQSRKTGVRYCMQPALRKGDRPADLSPAQGDRRR